MRMLYLSHVCWNWIFQRPHILALLLEKDYDVDVIDRVFIFGKKKSRNNKIPKSKKNIYQFPKNDYSLISKINHKILKAQLGNLSKYDIIWICHPMDYDCIPNNYKRIVIYDCMDDHVSMAQDEKKEDLRINEEELLKRADIVFVSSDSLRNKHFKYSDKIVLVRNGLSIGINRKVDLPQNKKKYSLGYFGTISTWFDFETLEESLRHNSSIEYCLIGPIENGTIVPKNERISFQGIVEHEQLAEYTDNYSALIMPFIVNNTILSVDPVKLYEYMGLGKCIISVWYPEIERFSDYVYFYKTIEEYNNLIDDLCDRGFPPKYSEEERNQFLESNTWDKRYSEIKAVIDNATTL